LVELESALTETLQHRLGLSPALGARDLEQALQLRGLDAASTGRVVSLLGELRKLGQSLATRNPKRPSSALLKRLEGEGMHLLRTLERLGDAARGGNKG
jgi:hypothetical protein